MSISVRLYSGGASVALVSRRIAPLHEICKRIDPSGKRTFPLEVDVRDPHCVQMAIGSIIERFRSFRIGRIQYSSICSCSRLSATPRILDSGKETVNFMAAAHPMKRLATREEVADLVAYLLSERDAFIMGSVHCIDEGYTAQ